MIYCLNCSIFLENWVKELENACENSDSLNHGNNAFKTQQTSPRLLFYNPHVQVDFGS